MAELEGTKRQIEVAQAALQTERSHRAQQEVEFQQAQELLSASQTRTLRKPPRRSKTMDAALEPPSLPSASKAPGDAQGKVISKSKLRPRLKSSASHSCLSFF